MLGAQLSPQLAAGYPSAQLCFADREVCFWIRLHPALQASGNSKLSHNQGVRVDVRSDQKVCIRIAGSDLGFHNLSRWVLSNLHVWRVIAWFNRSVPPPICWEFPLYAAEILRLNFPPKSAWQNLLSWYHSKYSLSLVQKKRTGLYLRGIHQVTLLPWCLTAKLMCVNFF